MVDFNKLYPRLHPSALLWKIRVYRNVSGRRIIANCENVNPPQRKPGKHLNHLWCNCVYIRRLIPPNFWALWSGSRIFHSPRWGVIRLLYTRHSRYSDFLRERWPARPYKVDNITCPIPQSKILSTTFGKDLYTQTFHIKMFSKVALFVIAAFAASAVAAPTK